MSRKSEKKSHLPCSPLRNKMRTDSPNQTRTNLKLEVLSSHISPDDPKFKLVKLGNLNKVEKSGCFIGQLDATKGVGEITAGRRVATEVLSCVQQLTATEKGHIIQRASAFKSTKKSSFYGSHATIISST
ncbi:hypothetical protein CRYUN_Cryun39dG0064500 [Craigia yunnanensis]